MNMNSSTIPVITIDGPSGAGKGTVAQMLALDLNWNILDSGALYRTLAFLMNENDISLEQFDEKANEIKKMFKVSFDPGIPGEPVKVIFNKEDITSKIRTEEIAKITSTLATEPKIREFIKPCQREFMISPGLIADGRDMGSVVFPEAKIKIYLDASIEERAKRRQIQLKEKGMEVNMRNLISSLEDRDLKDKNRDVSPLLIPEGAKVIDSTNLSIDEVVNKIMDLI